MSQEQKEEKLASGGLMERIKKGEVKRHSKGYFLIRGLTYALIIIAVLGFCLFLGSFIFFAIRATGIFFLPIFGLLGLRVFFLSFPWILILIVTLLIILTEGLLKKFHVVYSKPLLYSVVAVIALVFLGSFIVERTHLHVGLFERAQNDMLPIMGPVYRGFGGRQINDTYIGEVTAVLTDTLIIETTEGREMKVVISSETNCPCGIEQIDTGDMVVVVGKEKNGEISALGVNEITEDDNMYWRRPPRNFPRGPGPAEGFLRETFNRP